MNIVHEYTKKEKEKELILTIQKSQSDHPRSWPLETTCLPKYVSLNPPMVGELEWSNAFPF